MSSPQAPGAVEDRWAVLPEWLRPRASELPGTGRLRLIETTLLVLVGVILATATIDDVARQAGVNQRLIADLKTWRHYTRHDFHDLSISQELLGPTSTQREVVCGNTRAGPPKTTSQICLAVWGPVVDGRRAVHGGWYLPVHAEDVRVDRYGCFGEKALGQCPR
jgi:hypothetical protein